MRASLIAFALSLSLSLAACAPDHGAQYVVAPQTSEQAASIRKYGSFYSDADRRDMRSQIKLVINRSKKGT